MNLLPHRLLPISILEKVCIIGSTAAWLRGAHTNPRDLDFLVEKSVLEEIRLFYHGEERDEGIFNVLLDEEVNKIDFYNYLSDNSNGDLITNYGEVIAINNLNIRVGN